jgi:hypothetical protein
MLLMKNIYIFRESRLPKDGWIQSCFHCYEFTSREILYKREQLDKTIYQFNVTLCPRCRRCFRENPSKNIEFSKKCDNYIARHYSLSS